MPRGVDRWDEARLQGRLWTPLCFSAVLMGWWDAADVSTITVATGVSQWNSKVGGINAAQATTGQQPVYSATARRGYPGLTFDGSNDVLTISSTTGWASGTAELTMFVVGYSAVTGWRSAFTVGSGGGTSRAVFISSGGFVTGTTATNAGDHISSTNWNGADRIAMWIVPSGASATTTVCGEGVDNTAAISLGSFTPSTSPSIGGYPFASQYWSGTIHEVMFINRALSVRDRRALEGYAAWKWGLVGNLTANHPFKNRPPLIGD